MKPLFPRGAVAPKKGTLLGGAVYLLVYLFGLRLLLAPLMQLLNVDIPTEYGAYLANVAFFSINFICVALIFRRFLFDSFAPLKERRLGWFFLAVGIGYGICVISSNLLTLVYTLLDVLPDNLNNETVGAMLTEHAGTMLLFTCIFAPITEECLFRGVLFGPFVRKCPWLGYLLSALLFSFIHIMNSIGAQSVRDLLLCFLQIRNRIRSKEKIRLFHRPQLPLSILFDHRHICRKLSGWCRYFNLPIFIFFYPIAPFYKYNVHRSRCSIFIQFDIFCCTG